MIILSAGYGNHSNRLFQTIHLEAFCKENKINYFNLSFYDMSRFYFHRNMMWLKYAHQLFLKLKSFGIIKTLNISDIKSKELLIEKLKEKKILFIEGWDFKATDLTKKYQDYFIDRYSLKPDFYINNTTVQEIIKLKSKGCILIGVHIRKGDYKEWAKGKYYFTDTVYQKYMAKFKFALEKEYKQKYIFIIFSDCKTKIEQSENIYISKNDWYIDQFLMSKCDYIFGPPSTFSLWASYIGKTKYLHLYNDSSEIKLQDFSFCYG